MNSSIAPISFLSVLQYIKTMKIMKTISEIRRDNLAALIGEAGNQSALAEKVGCTAAQINQLIKQGKDSKTKKPRSVGDVFARRLEAACNKPVGWMDNINYLDARSTEVNAMLKVMEDMSEYQVRQARKIILAIKENGTELH